MFYIVIEKILVATRNKGKMIELVKLLRPLEITLVSLNDLLIEEEIEETGKTFAENAIVKAERYGELGGLPTIADDSGIEVDALGGAPGIYSARYGGEGFTDLDRNNLLLKNVKKIPDSRLTARFRCVVALWVPGNKTVTFEGKIEGMIRRFPSGNNGFGYDPIFFYKPMKKTLADITSEEKEKISHRGYAVRMAREYLSKL